MEHQHHTVSSPDSLGYTYSGVVKATTKPRRPCDSCRRRKSRCEIQDGETKCVLCKFHNQPCTFRENPQPRKRRKVSDAAEEGERASASSSALLPLDPTASSQSPAGSERRPTPSVTIRQDVPIDDYANLRGPSLLKKTLGLQSNRHSRILGLTSEFEPSLLNLPAFDQKEEINLGLQGLRKVTKSDTFLMIPDSSTLAHAEEMQDADAIEKLVAPYGRELINLYFRIVHPSFPILHKKVFLEKYERTHREFSPPLLAAVYLLAINWWSYSTELSLVPKPDTEQLELLASRTMAYVVTRPKLSTIQAGLLLLQRPNGDSWSLTATLVALGQDLGLHLDCSRWKIPRWEIGLRKRVAWGLFIQDKWSALVNGRPSHITYDDWLVKPVTEHDFPERSAEENEEEGSTEVEKGRVLFSEMIKLTEILTMILSEFYTLKAEEEFRLREHEGGRWILERAKPIQIALKNWFAQLPDILKLESIKMRKLNSTGYLYLAYYVAEITLHRRIIRSLGHERDPSLLRICRSAANSRLASVTEFVKSLRPEHLQSFWYWSSKYCFAVIGTFISLLWNTAANQAEAEVLKEKLEEYRWTLRLRSSAEILDRAASMLATSTGVLVKAIPPKTFRDPSGEGSAESDGDGESEEIPQASDVSLPATSPYSEGAFALLWQDFSMVQTDSPFDASLSYQTEPDGSNALMGGNLDLSDYQPQIQDQ